MGKTKGVLLYLLTFAVAALLGSAFLSQGSKLEESARIGSGLSAQIPAASASGPLSRMRKTLDHPLPLLLCQLIVVVAAASLCGWLFRRMGQPSVIGEMAAGIALGPSLLGQVLPAWETFLFPPASLGNLNLLSQVGIILFMFSVGMEIDLGALRKNAKVAVFVSHAGIVLPFVLGMFAALFLFRDYAPQGVRFPAFALFMGIAMSITAFPVLARILEERGLASTPLGNTAMASAAVDDVTAWIMLAGVITIARAQSPLSAIPVALLACLFTLGMLFLLRPLAARWLGKWADGSQPGRALASLILIGIFLSALATEAIGIHSLFGAFLAGTIMPSARPLRTFLRDRLEYTASLFLLPVFFASTGLRTQIGVMDDGRDWLVFLGLLALAVLGKFGGGSLAARFTGTSWRDAFALGALMNTRGLMELIVLNVGLDLGILSPRIFTMLVLVALVTTAMTGPALSLLKVGAAPGGSAPLNQK